MDTDNVIAVCICTVIVSICLLTFSSRVLEYKEVEAAMENGYEQVREDGYLPIWKKTDDEGCTRLTGDAVVSGTRGQGDVGYAKESQDD